MNFNWDFFPPCLLFPCSFLGWLSSFATCIGTGQVLSEYRHPACMLTSWPSFQGRFCITSQLLSYVRNSSSYSWPKWKFQLGKCGFSLSTHSQWWEGHLDLHHPELNVAEWRTLTLPGEHFKRYCSLHWAWCLSSCLFISESNQSHSLF